MTTPISKIKPNPFRDLGRNPLDPEKVEALKASIRSTGFWDNVVARERKDGSLELAYGHNRVEAARQELGSDAEIGLIVKPLSDENMIRVMAAENKGEWNHSSLAQQESVRAVVQAYGAGKIEIDPPGSKARMLRYAPGFILDQGSSPGQKPYTEASIAAFLGSGWKSETVGSILVQLEEIERGTLADETFSDVSPRYAKEVVAASRHAERIARQAGMDEKQSRLVAREVADEIADQVREGSVTLHGSTQATALHEARTKAIGARVPKAEPVRGPLPPPHQTVAKLSAYIANVFERLYDGRASYGALMEAVVANANSPSLRPNGPKGVDLAVEVSSALRVLAEQATLYADRIDDSRRGHADDQTYLVQAG